MELWHRVTLCSPAACIKGIMVEPVVQAAALLLIAAASLACGWYSRELRSIFLVAGAYLAGYASSILIGYGSP